MYDLSFGGDPAFIFLVVEFELTAQILQGHWCWIGYFECTCANSEVFGAFIHLLLDLSYHVDIIVERANEF